MSSIIELDPFELEKLSINEYFKTIEFSMGKSNSVDELTNFFSTPPFPEFESYRRKLKPKDKRFLQIELVYSNKDIVTAICWDLEIVLSRLVDIFGQPIIHNEPYSNSTAFAFKSDNPNIAIIKTRHSEWLKKLKHKNSFEYQDQSGQTIELDDPIFSFVQFSLAE